MKKLALCLVLLAAACGGSSNDRSDAASADLGRTQEDLAGADLAGPDLAPPDLAVGDLEVEHDLASIDLALPDLAVEHDLALPDLAVEHDLALPDLALPDMTLVCPGTQVVCDDTCVDETSNATYCGSCTNACSAPHTTSKCTTSACAIDTCTTGYADCNTTYADGCEVNTTNDRLHCGGCSATACALDDNCVASKCTAVTLDFTQPPTDYAFSSNSRPSAVVAGDFDNDGKVDLFAFTGNSGEARMYLGDGAGGYKTGSPIVSSLNNYFFAQAGDLDQDGKLDVIAGGYYGVAIYLGKGDGSFKAAATYGDSTSSYSVDGLAVADFNGDGYLDAAITDYMNDTIYLFFNDKKGAFLPPTTLASGQTGGKSAGIVAADWNHDGAVDLAVANTNASNISVFLNDKTGAFTLKSTIAVAVQKVAAGDIDGDGIVDLIAGAGSSNHALFLGVGDGTFGSAFPFSTPGGTGGIAVGDLNGDGKDDIVMSNVADTLDANHRRTVSVFLGGGGAMAPLQYTNTAQGVFSVGAGPQAPILVDWDHNGQLDIVTPNNGYTLSPTVSYDTLDILFNATK